MSKAPPTVDLSADAALVIRDNGGKLYVWTQRQVCCKGRNSLRTQVSFENPGHHDFVRAFESEQVEIYLAEGVSPNEVTVAMTTFPKRKVVAFWPNCVHQ